MIKLYSKQISNFVQNLGDLRDFVESVSDFLNKASSTEVKKNARVLIPFAIALSKLNPDSYPHVEKEDQILEQFFGDDIIIGLEEKDEGGNTVTLKMKGQGGKRFTEALERLNRTLRRNEKLYNSALISLVSSAEWFVAQLIHEYYERNKDSTGIKEKTLTLDDLFKIGNLEDARKYLIDRKAESILRGDVLEWIDFFKKELHLSMSYLKDIECDLIKICKRRNVLVHNGGVINSIYLSSLPKGYSSEYKLNEIVRVDKYYLEKAICNFEIAFVLIGMELWKRQETRSQKRGNMLLELSFNHIKAGRYKNGEYLSFFCMNDKGLENVILSMATVNYWQHLNGNNVLMP